MTNTYAPEMSGAQIVNSIYYYTPGGVWAPGIAFPSGSAYPTKSDSCHDKDFYYCTSSGTLWQYQGGDYPSGDWENLGTSGGEIDCGNTLPGSASELDLYNKYDEGTVYQWITVGGTSAWRDIGPNAGGLPLGADAITFTDLSKTWRTARLGLILCSDTGSSPLLATDVGFVVKKDLTAGGFIGTNQGEVWIGHGRQNDTDEPKIVMMHSADGYDTLYLTKIDCSSPAHLNLGNLTANGALFFNDTDMALYRPTTGSQAYQDTLIIQTPTDGGVAIEQNLWCNALAVNGNMGIGGSRFTMFNSSESYIEMQVGESASNCGCVVFGYSRSTDRGYIQMYDVGPLGCMQIIGSEAGSQGAIAIYKLYYHTMSQYDTLDDLSLVKNYDVETIIEDDVEKSVIAKESLSFLKADIKDDLWDMGKVTGFTLGCIKALVQRIENLESQIQKTKTTGGD